MFQEPYPASMIDIQKWNIRELVLCIEWSKTFEEFIRLSESDQVRAFCHVTGTGCACLA